MMPDTASIVNDRVKYLAQCCLLHFKRISYQTHIWQRLLDQFIRVDSPVGNGWFMDDSRLDIEWMTFNPVPDEVRIERLFSFALTSVKTYNFKFNL